MPQPSPRGLSVLLREEVVDENRSLFCAHYDECLDAALRERWRSWTCAQCPLFAGRAQELPLAA